MNLEWNLKTGKEEFRGLIVEQSPDSLLVTARKEFYVPEKKIVLLGQASEEEVRILKNSAGGRTGWLA